MNDAEVGIRDDLLWVWDVLGWGSTTGLMADG